MLLDQRQRQRQRYAMAMMTTMMIGGDHNYEINFNLQLEKFGIKTAAIGMVVQCVFCAWVEE
jgi:hypothetical protein